MKYLLDFRLKEISHSSPDDAMLVLEATDPVKGRKVLGEARPGQFVNIQVLRSHSTFLRRPISICDVDADRALLYLYVKNAGPATAALCSAPVGETFSILMPLGNGFDFSHRPERPLLIAGGVGIAPMLLTAKEMNKAGIRPGILIGAVSADRLILTRELAEAGELFISTDDGSLGEKGFVSQHSALGRPWTDIYCCGPLPMMKNIASIAAGRDIPCQVSLENVMACGVGACLCCVEDTKEGNLCVCKEGPVFDTKRLKW